MENRRNVVIKMLVSVSFLLMIAMNVLANAIRFNGYTTGEVSDRYPNLFAPAGYTFVIWGLIYLLTALHVLYQLGVFRGKEATGNEKTLFWVAVAFTVSNVANTVWIFAWHYLNIPLSMVMTLIMLVSLGFIMEFLHRKTLSTREKLFVRLPFSVYFGWITVATIANASVLLVSLGWDRWGLSESFWMVMILITGVLIGAARIHRGKDPAYGIVLVWAYAGILVKHITPPYSGMYPGVIAVIAISIVALIADIGCVEVSETRKLRVARGK